MTELDALVAERLGWTDLRVSSAEEGRWHTYPVAEGRPPGGTLRVVPSYSTDIEAAWELMELDCATVGLYRLPSGQPGKMYWQCCYDPQGRAFHAECSTAPEAICRAFLLATDR